MREREKAMAACVAVLRSRPYPPTAGEIELLRRVGVEPSPLRPADPVVTGPAAA